MRISNGGRALLLALLATAVLACGAENSMAPSSLGGPSLKVTPLPPVVPTVLGNLGILAVCTPSAYAIDVQLIGPNGGKLKAGKHEFKIPAGALSATVQITMEAMPGLNRTVRFSPEGLLFNPAHLPSLKLDTKGCALPKKGSEAKVAYVNETLHILNLLPSVIDSLAGTTDAHLKHFSRYAVAW